MQDSDSRALIEIFKDLHLKEKKLNIRFQDLAFESNRKRKELERIKITLDEMKSLNQLSYSKKIDTTYNILKNNDIVELSIKKQQDIQNIDALGFRILASLINLLSRSTFLLQVIHKKTISPDRNLLAYYRVAIEYLESIKNVQNFETTEAIRMHETDFSKFYLTELEAESQSKGYSSNYFSSTKKFNRLKNVLLTHFEDNRNIITLFITFLEEDHVARSYLTIDILQSYLNNKSEKEVIKRFGSLLEIIHKEHVDKIGNIASLNKELLAAAQRAFLEDMNRGTKYYLTEKPEMLEKFRAEIEADKSQEFIKDPRFNSRLKKIHKSHSNESRIIFKPIDRFGLRKSSRKPAESPTPSKQAPTPPSSSTQPLFFQRRSMSSSTRSFKASLRTKNVLQEVLALDQKMQYLNFQEKKISREVKKILPLTARLPIRYSAHSNTHKSPSSTRPATSRGVPMRASSLDVTQRSSSELKKRKVNKDNVI